MEAISTWWGLAKEGRLAGLSVQTETCPQAHTHLNNWLCLEASCPFWPGKSPLTFTCHCLLCHLVLAVGTHRGVPLIASAVCWETEAHSHLVRHELSGNIGAIGFGLIKRSQGNHLAAFASYFPLEYLVFIALLLQCPPQHSQRATQYSSWGSFATAHSSSYRNKKGLEACCFLCLFLNLHDYEVRQTTGMVCIWNGILFPTQHTTFDRGPLGFWSKVVHCVGNRVPFWDTDMELALGMWSTRNRDDGSGTLPNGLKLWNLM
jgi:hypothetical protein